MYSLLSSLFSILLSLLLLSLLLLSFLFDHRFFTRPIALSKLARFIYNLCRQHPVGPRKRAWVGKHAKPFVMAVLNKTTETYVSQFMSPFNTFKVSYE